MSARFVRPTDAIEVKQIGVLFYGQPGSRKTSLAQTARKPFTLAFDQGIYRAHGRKECAMFETWEDVVELTSGRGERELVAAFNEANTIVLDTVSAGMKLMAAAIVAESPKNGNRMGGLSLQGYGMLASRFGMWVGQIKSLAKDLVMVAQEDSERRGDDTYYMPSFVGQKFYNTAMEYADAVGYMHFSNGKRVIDFAPTDRWFAKVPPTGWDQLVLPDFDKEPDFLGKLLADAKESMGKISGESSAVAEAVASWQAKLDPDTVNLEVLNGPILDEYKAITNKAIKPQVWAVLVNFAEKFGFTPDHKTKKFVQKEGAAA